MGVKRAGLVLRERTQCIECCRLLAFSGYAIVIQADVSPVIDLTRKALNVKSAAPPRAGTLRYG